MCRSKISGGGVVHSYTDSLEEMKELIDLDLYIGMDLYCSLTLCLQLNVS